MIFFVEILSGLVIALSFATQVMLLVMLVTAIRTPHLVWIW
jgi:hypothetical protein